MIYEDSSAVGLAVGWGGANATTMIVKGGSTSGVDAAIGPDATAGNIYVLGGTFNGTGQAFLRAAVSTGVDTLTMLGVRVVSTYNSNLAVVTNGGSASIRNCTFAWSSPTGYYWEAAWSGGTAFTFQNNIVAGANHAIQVLAGSTVSADNNDYFGSMDFSVAGTTWGSLSAFRAAMFVGDLTTGDTSISTSSGAYALGAGADAAGVQDAVTALYESLVQ
jgi:hypothetical protein